MALFGGKKKDNNVDPFGGMDMSANAPPNMPDMNSMQNMNQMPNNMPQDYGQQQQYYDQQQGQFDGPQDMGPPPMEMPQDYGQQQYDQGFQPTYTSQEYQQPMASQDGTKERIEEIAEAIIDEKWNELIRDINKVIEWKERSDGEIKKIQQEIIDLKERFDALHNGVLGKIGEYDQNLSNVGSEIKAMEMTFQKILPTFTENVNKLDRLIKNNSPK
jgi:hypothetical protein